MARMSRIFCGAARATIVLEQWFYRMTGAPIPAML
jgi:hypothetical protein